MRSKRALDVVADCLLKTVVDASRDIIIEIEAAVVGSAADCFPSTVTAVTAVAL